MYNRYVPQSDGSYRKKKIPEPQRRPQQKVPNCNTVENKSPQLPIPPQESCSPPKPCKASPCNKNGNFFSFFSQLLPKDLDATDLMIILLLLLIAGDQEEDKSNALLTLALYFIL